MSEQITGYSVAGVIEADPGNQFVWVKFVDAQTVMDVAVAAAEQRVIAAAVQRVEAFEYISTIGVTLSSVVPKAAVIAAIKGDQR